MRYTVAVDFDGVLHSYVSPWVSHHHIPDPPVGGAIEWLHQAAQKFDIVIFTTRGKTWRGRRAVRRWLKKHAGNLWYDGLEDVKVTAIKPGALVYIDDRAWRFDGLRFPSATEIHAARPWNKSGGAASAGRLSKSP